MTEPQKKYAVISRYFAHNQLSLHNTLDEAEEERQRQIRKEWFALKEMGIETPINEIDDMFIIRTVDFTQPEELH